MDQADLAGLPDDIVDLAKLEAENKFSKNKDVISVGYANGRASDIFDEQQFGSASEAEILTLIVKENKGNVIFDELYEHLKLSKEKNGYIFKHESISKSSK